MAQEMIAGVARLSGPASSLNMAQLLFEGEARRPDTGKQLQTDSCR